MLALGGRTFSALVIPNFRLYFAGQSISYIGTWMQTVAQSWLVFTLTHSATDLGFVVGLQTLPILLLGPYGGVIADRVDRRRLMVILQGLMGLQAAALGILAITHLVTYWEVCVLAGFLGLNNTFENPSRQVFMHEMVGANHIRNAVSLNSTMRSVARAIGPAAAGVLIATVGTGICFLINAATFIGVVLSLLIMDGAALQSIPRTARRSGGLREGFAYILQRPRLGVPLVMMALVGTLAYEFQVVLPVLAQRTFEGNAAAYGFLTAAMGGGAIIGGLVTATRGRTGIQPLSSGALSFGIALVLATLAPTLDLEFAAMAAVGWTSIAFMATANATLQLEADPAMRGRVIALWAVAFMGTTALGGPFIGWVVSATNGRVGLGAGALVCFVASALGAVALRGHRVRMS